MNFDEHIGLYHADQWWEQNWRSLKERVKINLVPDQPGQQFKVSKTLHLNTLRCSCGHIKKNKHEAQQELLQEAQTQNELQILRYAIFAKGQIKSEIDPDTGQQLPSRIIISGFLEQYKHLPTKNETLLLTEVKNPVDCMSGIIENYTWESDLLVAYRKIVNVCLSSNE